MPQRIHSAHRYNRPDINRQILGGETTTLWMKPQKKRRQPPKPDAFVAHSEDPQPSKASKAAHAFKQMVLKHDTPLISIYVYTYTYRCWFHLIPWFVIAYQHCSIICSSCSPTSWDATPLAPDSPGFRPQPGHGSMVSEGVQSWVAPRRKSPTPQAGMSKLHGTLLPIVF